MTENRSDLSDSTAIPDTSVSEDEREPDSSETAHSAIEPHPRERVPSLDILSLMSCFLAIGALILLHSLYVRDPKDSACLPVELILRENPDLITIQIVNSYDSGSSAVSLVDGNNSEISQSPSTVNFSGMLNSNRTGMFNVLISLAPNVRVKKIWQKSWNASLAAFRRIGKRSKGEMVVRSGDFNESANISDRKASLRTDGYVSLFHVRDQHLICNCQRLLSQGQCDWGGVQSLESGMDAGRGGCGWEDGDCPGGACWGCGASTTAIYLQQGEGLPDAVWYAGCAAGPDAAAPLLMRICSFSDATVLLLLRALFCCPGPAAPAAAAAVAAGGAGGPSEKLGAEERSSRREKCWGPKRSA